MGGTCGGFIDDGTYGTGDYTIEINVVDKKHYTVFSPSSGGHLYALVEQNYDAPSTVAVTRMESFDGNDDGTVVFNAATSGPAKITVGYKGSTGGCAQTTPSLARDCYMMTTWMDVDARKIVIPLEFTSVEDMNLARMYISGDLTIASFDNYLGPEPPMDEHNFPNPMRFGIVAPVYTNTPLVDLNMDVIFQPDDDGRTILMCSGTSGNLIKDYLLGCPSAQESGYLIFELRARRQISVFHRYLFGVTEGHATRHD